MSNIIKLKRGLSTNIGSASLQQGEVAITTDTLELYTNNGTNNVKITQKGDSGVYIGETEPTDPDVNVWIDTTGESDIVTTPPYQMDYVIAANAASQWADSDMISDLIGGEEGYFELWNALRKDPRMVLIPMEGATWNCYNITTYYQESNNFYNVSFSYIAPGTIDAYVDAQINYDATNKTFYGYSDMGHQVLNTNIHTWAPSGWAIVGNEYQATDENTLYFIVPACKEIDTSFTINADVSLPSDFVGDSVMLFSEAVDNPAVAGGTGLFLPEIGESSTMTVGVDYPKQEAVVKMALDFSQGEDISLFGVFEVRNPETTALEWYCSAEYYDVTSGAMYDLISDNDYITSYNIPASGYVPSFQVTIAAPAACLVDKTLIKTKDGSKLIGELVVGDKVIAADGSETIITKVHSHKAGAVYGIMTDKKERIEATVEHKFATNYGIVPACNLVKDLVLQKDNGETSTITGKVLIKKECTVCEIATESNNYVLDSGIVCACEVI